MIAPVWFIVFGAVWLAVFVVVLIAALQADDGEDHDLDCIGEWTSR